MKITKKHKKARDFISRRPDKNHRRRVFISSPLVINRCRCCCFRFRRRCRCPNRSLACPSCPSCPSSNPWRRRRRLPSETTKAHALTNIRSNSNAVYMKVRNMVFTICEVAGEKRHELESQGLSLARCRVVKCERTGRYPLPP